MPTCLESIPYSSTLPGVVSGMKELREKIQPMSVLYIMCVGREENDELRAEPIRHNAPQHTHLVLFQFFVFDRQPKRRSFYFALRLI